MQDIHSIGGGGGDRRMRPHHHQNHQSLKCPRCESLNTKFCYYNNYNLSQPRHFCKNCRRYWTKGGVLRNVPVGGGCRKTKRSKPKTSSASATATADAPRDRKSNSHSSSESSSLTASTTAAPPSTVEVASASSSTSASTLLNFPDSRFFNSVPQATNPSFRHHHPPLIDQSSSDGGIFPEIGGSFTSLMTSSNDSSSILGFNIADISASAYRLHQNHGPVGQNQNSNQMWQEQQEKMGCSVPNELKMQQISAGFMDQTAQVDLSGMQNRENNGGLGGLDWQIGGDQGLFDFTGTVDQAYWSQTQWNDSDHHLYLP